MTIIPAMEIGDIEYKVNEIKLAIINNEPIEEKLNVIIVVSNPCLYARRYILLKEFVNRILMEDEATVNLHVVEMVYGKQPFMVTEATNPRHLQLRTTTSPIWHKENMVNLGVKYLLPKDYKAFAWIDADVDFESGTWAVDTLKILNGCKDIVQVFSHCIDMTREGTNLNIFNGFGYSFAKQKAYTSHGADYWHPGYAWAMTRKAYERLGGLYEKGVLGSGDSIMALSFIGKSRFANNKLFHKDYNDSMLQYEERVKTLRLGYVPGVIRHHYHGTKANRRYTERWLILMKHQFSPVKHLTTDAVGILIPSEQMSDEFQEDILNYFHERKEDD